MLYLALACCASLSIGAILDTQAGGYYTSSGSRINGVPSGFTGVPGGIGASGLEELHEYCVAEINKYRDGTLKFSDGTTDSNVAAGLTALEHVTGVAQCSNEQSLGDLVENVAGNGGCAGSHATAFSCTPRGSQGQNSCCGRGDGSWGSWDTSVYDTVAKVKSELSSCLQSMWDEGIEDGQKGHWETMRSTTFTKVACGFAWTTSGRIMMNQDFTTGAESCTPECTDATCPSETCGLDCLCGGDEDPPEDPQDTEEPAEEDPPADDTELDMQGTCNPGQVQACDGACWYPDTVIASYVGNGVCDDFLAWGYSLSINCNRFNCDGGDCEACAGQLNTGEGEALNLYDLEEPAMNAAAPLATCMGVAISLLFAHLMQ